LARFVNQTDDKIFVPTSHIWTETAIFVLQPWNDRYTFYQAYFCHKMFFAYRAFGLFLVDAFKIKHKKML
jgi:hypothetical protein